MINDHIEKYSEMPFHILQKRLISYKNTFELENKINTYPLFRKIRHSNFPSDITENIVRKVLQKIYSYPVYWNIQKGDLEIRTGSKVIKCEVKGSLDLRHGGPSSFGPKEKWDRLYFVDCRLFRENKFKVYEVKLSNKSKYWKNMKMNKTKRESFEDQCKQGRRPRITFTSIKKQLEKKCRLIFDGFLEELNDGG